MSEYDRGAYTPPTDESFAFDARSRLPRPAPATLIGSLVVLVVLVGAVALFYWSGVRGAGEAPRVVGKQQLEIKTAPPPVEAKPVAEDDKLDVYNQEKGQAAASGAPKTTLAPPPEEPQPRPAAQAQAPAAPPPAAATTAPPPLRTAQSASVASPPVKLASAPPAPAPAKRSPDAVKDLLARNDAAKAAPPAKVAPPPAKAAAEPAAPPADAAHRLMVQIGAYSSSAIADSELAKAKAAYAAYTVGKLKHVERAEVNGKTFYRAAFAGFDRSGAQAFCKALIPAGIHCIVK
jgi:hypothetical protein